MCHDRVVQTNPGSNPPSGLGSGFDELDAGEGTDEVTQVDGREKSAPGDIDAAHDFDDAVLDDIAVPSATGT